MKYAKFKQGDEFILNKKHFKTKCSIAQLALSSNKETFMYSLWFPELKKSVNCDETQMRTFIVNGKLTLVDKK